MSYATIVAGSPGLSNQGYYFCGGVFDFVPINQGKVAISQVYFFLNQMFTNQRNLPFFVFYVSRRVNQSFSVNKPTQSTSPGSPGGKPGCRETGDGLRLRCLAGCREGNALEPEPWPGGGKPSCQETGEGLRLRCLAGCREGAPWSRSLGLVAIADLITCVEDGLKVHEFKTSGRTYSDMEADTSHQPTCYVNAVQEVFGEPARVEYTVLVKTKTPKVQRLEAVRHDEDLGRLGDIVQTIEKAVDASIFYPVESPMNCSTCPYRQPCREWTRSSENTELIQLNIKPAEARAC